MAEYKFTGYFENEVLRKRPYLKREWCVQVCSNPVRVENKKETDIGFEEGLMNCREGFFA